MVRDLWLCVLRHHLGQHLLVDHSSWQGIGQGFVDVPLSNLLIVFVISAEHNNRRVVTQSLHIRDSLEFNGLDEFRIGRVYTTSELKVL